MNAPTVIGLLLLGLTAGFLGGLTGLGGGTIIIPAFVHFFGMSQHLAQGTALAVMIPPIGILAAWEYYRQGHVDLKTALLVCAGFLLGGLLGGLLAHHLPAAVLRRIFGAFLLLVSLRMLVT